MLKSKSEKILRLGGRNIHIRGLEQGFFGDFYHASLRATWPRFYFWVISAYLGANVFFATLLMLENGSVTNARPDSFADHFYFSVHTLATVGYGNMYPGSSYGHIITTIEILIGSLSLAVMTGLIFSRFSRPHARFIFAEKIIIAPFEGKKTLMIRVMNGRTNLMNNATAKLWMSRLHVTREGHNFRRFHSLKLERDENPVFALSWTLFHTIDETSPLFNLNEEDLKQFEVSFIASLRGYDEESAQEVFGRINYELETLRFNESYVDVIGRDESGEAFFDYTQFHKTKVFTQ